MPNTRARTALLLAASALFSCAAPSTDGAKTLEQDAADARAWLASMLTGSFSSAAQAASDPDNYFDIRLEVAPGWVDRADGPWLYVEQAAASALERPYRQRVYRLEGGGADGLRSVMYELPGDPVAFAGAFRDAAPLASLEPADLLPLPGCTVHLNAAGDARISGSTREDECGTQWGDAVYATSEVTLTPEWMESWDRGYDADGNQVWGATKGPYRFVRIE